MQKDLDKIHKLCYRENILPCGRSDGSRARDLCLIQEIEGERHYLLEE